MVRAAVARWAVSVACWTAALASATAARPVLATSAASARAAARSASAWEMSEGRGSSRARRSAAAASFAATSAAAASLAASAAARAASTDPGASAAVWRAASTPVRAVATLDDARAMASAADRVSRRARSRSDRGCDRGQLLGRGVEGVVAGGLVPRGHGPFGAAVVHAGRRAGVEPHAGERLLQLDHVGALETGPEIAVRGDGAGEHEDRTTRLQEGDVALLQLGPWRGEVGEDPHVGLERRPGERQLARRAEARRAASDDLGREDATLDRNEDVGGGRRLGAGRDLGRRADRRAGDPTGGGRCDDRGGEGDGDRTALHGADHAGHPLNER